MKKFFLQLHERMGILTILVIGLCMASFGLLANSFALSQPVPKITFSSQKLSYTEKKPGSWNVEKSAEWIGEGKARITFQVDSTLMINNKYTDVIFVLDVSGSMAGEKLDRVKEDSKELVASLLSDSHNQAALITFDTESEIVSGFTNKKDELIGKIDQLTDKGSTNYYQPLVHVDSILKNYQKKDDTECVVLFLTDGYPNVDIPNQVAEYQYLKSEYPWLNIHGVQYEMGEEILKPIQEISDEQFIANMDTLNNILFDASIVPISYKRFVLTDFINNTYFNLEDVSQIKASFGTAKLTQENGVPKVTWDLSGLGAGRSATLTIDIDLKKEYLNQGGIYPTNKSSEATSKIETSEEHVTTTESPSLQTHYQVIYDGNAPTGCTVSGVPKTTSHLVFSAVARSDEVPTCEGYQFKGWKVVTEGVEKLNDDYFKMPEKDVTIRAEWGKMTISKSMSGTVYTKPIPKLQKVGSSSYKEKLWQYKDSITKVIISNEIDAPEGSISNLTWDISYDGRGGVMGYLIPNNDGTNTYIAYIQGNGEIISNEDSSYLFYNFKKLIAIEGLKLVDTSQVTDMDSMFYNCSSLTSLDVSYFETDKVTDMGYMFDGCSNLTSLGDISNWNTSGVTTMAGMFYGCTMLESLNLSGWNTSQVIRMNNMFYNCRQLTNIGDLSVWDTSKVTSMYRMFFGCSSLKTLDVSHFVTNQVTDMSDMFQQCSSLTSLDLSHFVTDKVKYMDSMFYWCENLTNLGDLSNWNTSQVTDMSLMFWNCTQLTSLNLSSWNTSRVTNMLGMFGSCSSLTSLYLSGWNTSQVTDMHEMFEDCSSLTSIGDLNDWNSSQVTNMEKMFYNCKKLTSLGDLSSWKTSQVKNMSDMFYYCSSLTSIGDISNWNTSQVTTMESMFEDCSSLTSLNLSSWNTSQVITMQDMFDYCSSLTSLGDISNWNTSKVTNMSSMFNCCKQLTNLGDLSNWDTSKVTNMYRMFNLCEKLTTTINILNPFVTSYSDMFNNAATASNAKITVGYISETSDLVDQMIATQSANSHVEKVQIPEYSISIVGNSDIQADVQKAYASRLVTLSSTLENYMVISFKMNGTLIQGNTFIMPNAAVIITDITAIQIAIIESEHNPYPNSLNNKVYGEKTFTGAKSLTVVLEYETESTSWDYIYLYDNTGKRYGEYGGKPKTTETITIPGEYIKIVFKTDGSTNNFYGFKATITPNY